MLQYPLNLCINNVSISTVLKAFSFSWWIIGLMPIMVMVQTNFLARMIIWTPGTWGIRLNESDEDRLSILFLLPTLNYLFQLIHPIWRPHPQLPVSTSSSLTIRFISPSVNNRLYLIPVNPILTSLLSITKFHLHLSDCPFTISFHRRTGNYP